MSNTFGQLFRVTTFGESHGNGVGAVIDGCPAKQTINLEEIQKQLDRRRPGQSDLSTARNEEDIVECLSGLEDGVSLGSPIALLVKNKDQKSKDYSDLKNSFRPSHADFTTQSKYGIQASSGGGRASARETIGRVAAAGVARQVLESSYSGFKVVAFVDSVKDVTASVKHTDDLSVEMIDSNPVRCPDKDAANKMEEVIRKAKAEGDSVGGTITCFVDGVPAGLGEPVFDKLHADLAKAMLSIPACRGFEIGKGFASTSLFGSEHNDPFTSKEGTIRTVTNNSGGIQGGISNGERIWFRAAFKPVSTIFKEQDSVDSKGNKIKITPKGRHDPCVLPRAVPIVEAMTTLVAADHMLRNLSSKL